MGPSGPKPSAVRIAVAIAAGIPRATSKIPITTGAVRRAVNETPIAIGATRNAGNGILLEVAAYVLWRRY